MLGHPSPPRSRSQASPPDASPKQTWTPEQTQTWSKRGWSKRGHPAGRANVCKRGHPQRGVCKRGHPQRGAPNVDTCAKRGHPQHPACKRGHPQRCFGHGLSGVQTCACKRACKRGHPQACKRGHPQERAKRGHPQRNPIPTSATNIRRYRKTDWSAMLRSWAIRVLSSLFPVPPARSTASRVVNGGRSCAARTRYRGAASITEKTGWKRG